MKEVCGSADNGSAAFIIAANPLAKDTMKLNSAKRSYSVGWTMWCRIPSPPCVKTCAGANLRAATGWSGTKGHGFMGAFDNN